MKTNKIRLFATMVTLAAVTIITTLPATAQRRQSENERTETRVQKSNNRRSTSSTQKQKSTRKFETKKSVSKNSVNRNSSGKPANISRVDRNKKSRSKEPVLVHKNRSSSNKSVKQTQIYSPKKREAIKAAPQRNDRNINAKRQVERNSNSSVDIHSNRSSSGRDRSVTVNSNPNRINGRRSTGANTRNNSEMYRLNRNDKRYTPSRNYRGSNKVWTENRRPGKMNYNHADRNFYRNYNYRNHKHWDRSWERYRWNFSSWRDYYYGYNPYSYRYHRYYMHHPVYGHVIRKFDYRPNIFIHNNYRYYCYDGHFFRYLRGVGYVLVDIPFGIAFNQLPNSYERVYVNGYLYFRVGNLFFEMTDFGFQLVHYPERYYSFDNNYRNEGFYFGDDLYY